MNKLTQSVFESIVKEEASHTARIVKVVVVGFEVLATYASASGKSETESHLIFDENGEFVGGYLGYRSANAPKFLVDNILDAIKSKLS